MERKMENTTMVGTMAGQTKAESQHDCVAKSHAAPDGVRAPPRTLRGMRVALLVEGTRGDCQPYLALALRLQEQGCVVTVFSNSNYRNFVEGRGITFEAVFSDFEEQMRDEEMMASMKDGNTFQFFKALGKLTEQRFPGDFTQAWSALDIFGPDLLLYSIISQTTGQLYGKVNTIPAIPAFLCVYLTTGEVAPLGIPSTFAFVNRLMWKMVIKKGLESMHQKLEVAKAKLGRTDIIDLMPRTVAELTEVHNEPLTPKFIGCSPSVIKQPADVDSPNIHSTGWWTLDCSHQLERFNAGDVDFGGTDKHALETFLKAGSAPVYVGWGSMIAVSPKFMAELAVSALKQSGKRGVVLKGWSDLGPDLLADEELKAYAKESILFIRSAPHEWLLPKCVLSVTHGGSGTTAAALRAGKPAIITPVFLDQFDFAEAVNRLGVGVGTCQFKKVTADVLAAAIAKCVGSPVLLEAARALGEQLLAEDGPGRAVQLLREFVEGPLQNGAWLEAEEARKRRWAKARALGPLGSCCDVRHQIVDDAV